MKLDRKSDSWVMRDGSKVPSTPVEVDVGLTEPQPMPRIQLQIGGGWLDITPSREGWFLLVLTSEHGDAAAVKMDRSEVVALYDACSKLIWASIKWDERSERQSQVKEPNHV